MPSHIQPFTDRFLPESEDLIKNYPEIFSLTDFREYRTELIEYLLKLHHNKQNQYILISTTDHKPSGIIAFSKQTLAPNYWKIDWLIVKKSEQGNGLGRTLLESAIEKITEHQGKFVILETSSEKHNQKVKKFYELNNFKSVGIMPDFYPHPVSRNRPEDNIIYIREL
jgi:ribosomal protein S18 acetylase RimI-like enzyme